MNNRFSGLIAFILIILGIWINFTFDQPDYDTDDKNSPAEFSTQKAFEHVEALAQEPHFVGSSSHSKVRNYIVDQLQTMGLEVQTQEAYDLNAQAILVKPQNILAKIEGSGDGNALILMTHYDSASHSSYGASDAGSGIATILEGVRAYLAKDPEPKNDIILLFTDAEELGLNGASLFIKDHPWAKQAKLALNFEARGSGGNPFMLLETNGKNARLIEAFKEADPEYPVANSLAYSIYKMLPNDTDLTVLREDADINGYNFAFIDDHFDYHTANDTPENLDKETLAHQGTYLMPLLTYFSDADLTKLNSDRDLIYFSLPFGEFISYPFDWIFPMLILASVIFIILIVYGFRHERLSFNGIITGFLPMILSLVLSGLGVWLFWKFFLFIYPGYSEMEQGFTYNGYWYMTTAIILSLSICFFIYHAFRKKSKAPSAFIAPLFIWLAICGLVSLYLKGASYFIIPVFFGLLQLFIMIRQETPNRILMALLSYPALFVVLPFVWTLPVALGLKILFVSGILTSLLFLLLLPVFAYFKRLKSFGIVCFFMFNIFIFVAHFYSNFNEDRPKPNSLIYLKDLDNDSAKWLSYDKVVDDWTSEIFGKEPVDMSSPESTFSSKYGSRFTFQKTAPLVPIAEPSVILKKIKKDSLNTNTYSLKIAPNRPVHRIEIFEHNDVDFEEFKVNGLVAGDVYLGSNKFHMFTRRWKERLLTYYASNQDTLRIEFKIEEGDKPEFVIYESAYDLLENKELNIKARPADMIPRPFVLNDAIILKKTIRIKE
ncbi:M28 family peptidase [Christiangramia salexigens]|uniref:Vacuolar membrane protease n=1 Tax=Christiangramia salexigens TaxID=1913577 RepID=A0A1L3J753_9FLAO|nr:M28 family peptidase [Christiangramia salexigens]APG60948.1 peptidase M28 [Christiangramia salexigens]